MGRIGRVGVIGAGIIGASWASLFLAHGHDVAVHDPAASAEDGLRGFVRHALAQLADLGRTGQGRLSFTTDLSAALDGADFVQENAPEQEDLKRRLLAQVDERVPVAQVQQLKTIYQRILEKYFE